MISLEKIVQKKLDQILIDVGYVKQDKLEEAALQIQKDSTKTLKNVLLENKTIDEFALAHALCRELQIPFLSLENYSLSDELIQKFPKELMMKYHCVPIDELPSVITILVADVITKEMFEDINKYIKKKPIFYIGLYTELENLLNKYITAEEKTIHTQAILPEQQELTAGWESMFDDANEQVLNAIRKTGDGYINTAKQLEVESMLEMPELSMSQNEQLKSQLVALESSSIRKNASILQNTSPRVEGPVYNDQTGEDSSLLKVQEDSSDVSSDTNLNLGEDSSLINGNPQEDSAMFSVSKETEEYPPLQEVSKKTNPEISTGNINDQNKNQATQAMDFQEENMNNAYENSNMYQENTDTVYHGEITNNEIPPDEEDLKLELEKLAALLKKEPFNYDAVNRYVEIAVMLGNMQAAIAQLLLFAKGLHQAGDPNGAMNCYRYILELSPGNVAAKQYLSQYAPK